MVSTFPLASGGGETPTVEAWLGAEAQVAVVLGLVLLLGIGAYFFADVAVELAEE